MKPARVFLALLALAPRAQEVTPMLDVVRAWETGAALPDAEELEAFLDEVLDVPAEPGLPRALGALGHRLGQAGRDDEARRAVACSSTLADRSEDLETAGWARSWLGQNDWIAGRLDEAASFFAEAAGIEHRRGSTTGQVQELSNVVRVRMIQGRLDEALDVARSAEVAARTAGVVGALRRAAELRGTLLMELGHHREALELCFDSMPPLGAAVPEDEVQVRLDLLTAGLLADVGRIETAEAHARRALETARSTAVQRAAPLLVLEAELDLGLLLGDLGRFDEGLARLEEAGRGFAEAGDPRGSAWVAKNRGFVRLAAGRRAEARADLVEAEHAGRSLAVPWLEGISALGLAESLVFERRTLTAEEQTEVERCLAVVDARSAQLFERQFEWRAAAVRGHLQLARGRDDLALDAFRSAIEGIERWRRRLEVPGLVEHALRQRADPYREAALAAARLGRAHEALELATLLHERETGELGARRGGELGPAEDPEVEALRRRIGPLEYRIRQHPGDTSEEREELARVERELEDRLLGRSLRADPRDGADRREPLDTNLWLEALGAGVGLVFVVGEGGTLVLQLARERAPAIHLASLGRAETRALVARLRIPVADLEAGRVDVSNLGFDVEAARELHRRLVEPLAPPERASLVVVPDGELSALPFELLVTGGSPLPVDPRVPFTHLEGLTFLGDDHAITTTTGLRLPGIGRGAPAGRPTLVLVAPSDVGVLQGAREAEAVAAAARAGRVQVVEDATRAALLERVGSAGSLHFVGHGRLDDRAPASSHVVLGVTGSRGVPDRLEAWWIEDQDWDLERVVLSSCHSGEGAWYPGAGLAGLARSFLRAGAREVVATQWAVEDAATARFMGEFYSGLARGAETAEALREARLAVRHARDPRGFSLAHPYLWAAFVLRR